MIGGNSSGLTAPGEGVQDAAWSPPASAGPGNFFLVSLTYRSRLSSPVSAVLDLRHLHYRVRLLPLGGQ